MTKTQHSCHENGLHMQYFRSSKNYTAIQKFIFFLMEVRI